MRRTWQPTLALVAIGLGLGWLATMGPRVIDAPNEARWSSYTPEQCREGAFRAHSARLTEIPWWQDWRIACESTAGTPSDADARAPDRCVRRSPFGMWGEWDVPDPRCAQVASTPPSHEAR